MWFTDSYNSGYWLLIFEQDVNQSLTNQNDLYEAYYRGLNNLVLVNLTCLTERERQTHIFIQYKLHILDLLPYSLGFQININIFI